MERICEFRRSAGAMSEVLLSYEGVTKSYPSLLTSKPRVVFTDLDLEIHKGEILGLYGPSGCGKSTLFRMFFQLTDWSQGKIKYLGQDIKSLSPRARREMHRDVQMVFQDPRNAFNPRWLIERSMYEPLHLFNIYEDRKELIEQKLVEVGLESALLERYPHQLSGGQLQRLALARCLLMEPSCLLLDEASSMLDLSVQAQIMGLVRRLNEEHGLTVMLISHDLDLIKAMCGRYYRFEDGLLSLVEPKQRKLEKSF